MDSPQDLTQDLKGDTKTIMDNTHSSNSQTFEFIDKMDDKGGSDIYKNCDQTSTDNDSFDPPSNSEFSKSIQCGSESNFQTHQEFIKNNFFGKCFCKKCNIPCSVDFMDNLELKFECGCTYIEGFDILEFIKDYLNKKIEQSEDFQIYCPYHKEETEFLKYCTDCGHDLCKECLNENSETYSNTPKTNKAHENHTLIDLKEIMTKGKEIEESIDRYENNISYYILDKNLKRKLTNIFVVIRSILENYEKNKNYNSYLSIQNSQKFLLKIHNPKEYNFKINSTKGKYLKFIKQTSEKEFDININDKSKEIRIIHFNNIKKEIDFSLLKNKNFINLKELYIREMNFNDISPLFSCQFPVLENLDLENNGIDNTIIKLLEKLNLPELKILNLYKNKITDEKIFALVQKYNKLEHFFLGENPIEFDVVSERYYTFPETIEEFGLTGNMDPKTTNFVKKLNIENLKIFYISRNKIDNLLYLENIKFVRLQEFWAISNQITDIKQLMHIDGKQNLEIINLKDNQINNFNEFIDIVEFFPKLKKLTLTKNKINIPESEAIEMKKRIKEIYKYDIEIIV